ncbi:MAG: peptidoglycan DD-metalloendopeptidase family protein [Chloroflexi bacterium]|nr:peptidoglycan DD-metalloendopeptidase family protein [Chloroflexota bacterium]
MLRRLVAGYWFLLTIFGLLLLIACTPDLPETPQVTPEALLTTTPGTPETPDATPTLTPPILATPALPLPDENPPLAFTPAINNNLPPANPIRPALPTYTPLPYPTPVVVGTGVRPDEVAIYRAPDYGPTPLPELRPPPYPVPLALHPEDHYVLIRPIPSGFRNYDLEWYPYGNDVLLAQFYPYRVHHGLDFPNETGTPILAAGSGTVIYAGPLPSPRDGVNYYGNTVIIQHDWQWHDQAVYTLYAHTLELFVAVGDTVRQGDLIAGVGSSGEVSGPHLHLEVRLGENNYFRSRNPSLWIAPYEGWGVLAGTLTDNRGLPIQNGVIVVTPMNLDYPTRVVHTYLSDAVTPDDYWQENFVVADLPQGRYRVTLFVADRSYERIVDLLPGRTNYIAVQADIAYSAPPTPTFVATVGPSAPITNTETISNTVP